MHHVCKSFGRRFISAYACAAVFVLMCGFSAYAETDEDANNIADENLLKRIQSMSERIERLEAAKQPKMLAPHKDVDFLFEDVIGDIYDAADKKGALNVSNKHIKTIELIYHWYRGFWFSTDTVRLTFDDNATETLDNKDLALMLIEAKMQAVEKTLKIKPEPDDTLKERIGRAYEKINNKDWQNDDLRFGVLTAYLPDAHAIATSVTLHGYFAYRRFSPGKWDLHNFGRRLSGFFAVGAGSATDNSAGKSADIKTPVLSAGIGFDIVKGFVLSTGGSVFSYKSPAEQDYNVKSSWTVGITLNSDLWRTLFNNR